MDWIIYLDKVVTTIKVGHFNDKKIQPKIQSIVTFEDGTEQIVTDLNTITKPIIGIMWTFIKLEDNNNQSISEDDNSIRAVISLNNHKNI